MATTDVPTKVGDGPPDLPTDGPRSETGGVTATPARADLVAVPSVDLRLSDEAEHSHAVASPDPETEARAERRHKRLLTVSTWVMSIGALIILFGAWQLWGTAIEQAHSQNDLASQWAAKVHHPHPTFSLLRRRRPTCRSLPRVTWSPSSRFPPSG